jgi:hypothetical protein
MQGKSRAKQTNQSNCQLSIVSEWGATFQLSVNCQKFDNDVSQKFLVKTSHQSHGLHSLPYVHVNLTSNYGCCHIWWACAGDFFSFLFRRPRGEWRWQAARSWEGTSLPEKIPCFQGAEISISFSALPQMSRRQGNDSYKLLFIYLYLLIPCSCSEILARFPTRI